MDTIVQQRVGWIESPREVISEEELEAFLYGDCWYLAGHLHLRTGWEVWGVGQADEGNTSTAHDPRTVCWYHLMVRTPTGDFLDAKGSLPSARPEAMLDLHGVGGGAFLFRLDMERWGDYVHGQTPLYPEVALGTASAAQRLVSWYQDVASAR